MNFKVSKVIFYEDRASVIRTAQVELEPGVHSWTIEGLSPFIVDKTTMLDTSDEDVLCSELVVHREFVSQGTASQVIKKDTLDLESERQARALLSKSLENIRSNRTLLLHKIAQDTSKGIAEPKKWESSLHKLNKMQNEIFLKIEQLEDVIEEKGIALNDKKIAYKSLDDMPTWRSKIKVSIEAKKKCNVTLTLRYMTAGACWRPYSEAYIKGSNINFKLCARLWQNTGESWENFEYELSTQRLSKGGCFPPINSDYLMTSKRKTQELSVREESQKPATEINSVESIPGIEDKGICFKAKSNEKVSFPDFEQSIIVNYWQFNTDASTCLKAHPQMSEYVNEIVTFYNYAEIPILECPVKIFRDNVLVGQSFVKYKAPGEKVELDCGNIPEIRIKRRVTKKNKSKLMSTWNNSRNSIQLFISNLSNRPISFEIRERVPVSETEKVLVEIDGEESSPASFPDKKGIILWNIKCPAYGRKKIKLVYDIKIRKGSASVSIPV